MAEPRSFNKGALRYAQRLERQRFKQKLKREKDAEERAALIDKLDGFRGVKLISRKSETGSSVTLIEILTDGKIRVKQEGVAPGINPKRPLFSGSSFLEFVVRDQFYPEDDQEGEKTRALQELVSAHYRISTASVDSERRKQLADYLGDSVPFPSNETPLVNGHRGNEKQQTGSNERKPQVSKGTLREGQNFFDQYPFDSASSIFAEKLGLVEDVIRTILWCIAQGDAEIEAEIDTIRSQGLKIDEASFGKRRKEMFKIKISRALKSHKREDLLARSVEVSEPITRALDSDDFKPAFNNWKRYVATQSIGYRPNGEPTKANRSSYPELFAVWGKRLNA